MPDDDQPVSPAEHSAIAAAVDRELAARDTAPDPGMETRIARLERILENTIGKDGTKVVVGDNGMTVEGGGGRTAAAANTFIGIVVVDRIVRYATVDGTPGPVIAN